MDSYQESHTDGTLFLDLTRARGGDAPVVYVQGRNRSIRDLPLTFARLMKTHSKR